MPERSVGSGDLRCLVRRTCYSFASRIQPGVIDQQVFQYSTADDSLVNDSRYILDRNAAVPDFLWVNDNRGSQLTLIQASGGIPRTAGSSLRFFTAALKAVRSSLFPVGSQQPRA